MLPIILAMGAALSLFSSVGRMKLSELPTAILLPSVMFCVSLRMRAVVGWMSVTVGGVIGM